MPLSAVGQTPLMELAALDTPYRVFLSFGLFGFQKIHFCPEVN